MNTRFDAKSLVTVLTAVACLAASPSAQAQKGSAAKPVKAFKRMPGGHPDMRGTWVKAGGGLNEANGPTATIDTECVEFFRDRAEPKGFTNVGVPQPRPQYAPPQGTPNGIVDPPDRVLPFRPEALALRLDWAKRMGPPAESLKYIEMSARCIPPAPFQGGSLELLQPPGKVVLLFEGNHGSRVIYTDGRSHPSQNMLFFGGDSTGRWEGDTLVVDTANLNGWAHFGVARVFAPFSTALHFTERFTMMAPDLISYEMIYDDPNTFTRPVKSVGYLYPVDDTFNGVMELVCTEGSTTLRNIFGF